MKGVLVQSAGVALAASAAAHAQVVAAAFGTTVVGRLKRETLDADDLLHNGANPFDLQFEAPLLFCGSVRPAR